MRTFLQLQEEVLQKLKEEGGGFWIRQDVKDAINETYIFIADETFCFRLIHIIEIKAAIRTYKLPENYILGSLDRVEFNQKIIFPKSASELDSYSLTWRNISGSNIQHYLPPGDICGNDEISVYPLPDTDGTFYNLASTSKDYGVIVAVGDDSYEEFTEENGIIVGTDGEAAFEQADGIVLDIQDPTDNLRIFGAKYPKRLFNDDEAFLYPLTYNPQNVITDGSMAVLLAKEGEGKDIIKASYYNKRFREKLLRFQKPKIKRMHSIGSISDVASVNFNLGEHYPVYMRR